MRAPGFIVMVLFAVMFLMPGKQMMDHLPSFYAPAYAEDYWKTEFDDLCSRTQDVMAFTPEELKGFIQRCDKLKPMITKLGESESKVYLKRLDLCRNLFSYALEVKANGK